MCGFAGVYGFQGAKSPQVLYGRGRSHGGSPRVSGESPKARGPSPKVAASKPLGHTTAYHCPMRHAVEASVVLVGLPHRPGHTRTGPLASSSRRTTSTCSPPGVVSVLRTGVSPPGEPPAAAKLVLGRSIAPKRQARGLQGGVTPGTSKAGGVRPSGWMAPGGRKCGPHSDRATPAG